MADIKRLLKKIWANLWYKRHKRGYQVHFINAAIKKRL